MTIDIDMTPGDGFYRTGLWTWKRGQLLLKHRSGNYLMEAKNGLAQNYTVHSADVVAYGPSPLKAVNSLNTRLRSLRLSEESTVDLSASRAETQESGKEFQAIWEARRTCIHGEFLFKWEFVTGLLHNEGRTRLEQDFAELSSAMAPVVTSAALPTECYVQFVPSPSSNPKPMIVVTDDYQQVTGALILLRLHTERTLIVPRSARVHRKITPFLYEFITLVRYGDLLLTRDCAAHVIVRNGEMFLPVYWVAEILMDAGWIVGKLREVKLSSLPRDMQKGLPVRIVQTTLS